MPRLAPVAAAVGLVWVGVRVTGRGAGTDLEEEGDSLAGKEEDGPRKGIFGKQTSRTQRAGFAYNSASVPAHCSSW